MKEPTKEEKVEIIQRAIKLIQTRHNIGCCNALFSAALEHGIDLCATENIIFPYFKYHYAKEQFLNVLQTS